WLLAIITMGEGWHNNHHAYQSSARQGFYWWEYDPTFYLLTLLERLGLVWNLKRPTAEVMQNQHKLGSRVISRAAALVADSYYPDRIAAGAADPHNCVSRIENHVAEQTEERGAQLRRGLRHVRDPSAGVGGLHDQMEIVGFDDLSPLFVFNAERAVLD